MSNYILKVRFEEEAPAICVFNEDLKAGTKVVASMDEVSYLGVVISGKEATESDNISAYWPLIRVANDNDLNNAIQNKKIDASLIPLVQEQCNKLSLDMNIFRVTSSLDRTKCRVMYTSDQRVDFRELLKVLPKIVHSRIDLRQVGPRDKAKMIGGLGICGLKLCCSSFLNSFDGISIAMAKNQMLAINIPKLSGQCGKLICCLKFEDEAYAQTRVLFPKIGSTVKYEGNEMRVNGVNLLNKTVVLNGQDKYVTISLDDYNRVSKGLAIVKKSTEDVEDLKAYSDAINSTFNREPKAKSNNNYNQNQNRPRPNNNNNNTNNNNTNNNNNQNRNNNNQNRNNYQNGNKKHYNNNKNNYYNNRNNNRNNNQTNPNINPNGNPNNKKGN